MSGMLHDEDFFGFVRTRSYASLKSQAILGLSLARKVCICAPLFDSIPLSTENGEACLPVAPEQMDEDWLEEVL